MSTNTHLEESRAQSIQHTSNIRYQVSSCRSESPWYVPVGSMPCSSAMTSQNLAPIWFPHWPPWTCTSSRMALRKLQVKANGTDCFSTWGLTRKRPRSKLRCKGRFTSSTPPSLAEKKRTSETIACIYTLIWDTRGNSSWGWHMYNCHFDAWQCTADNQWHQHSSWTE